MARRLSSPSAASRYPDDERALERELVLDVDAAAHADAGEPVAKPDAFEYFQVLTPMAAANNGRGKDASYCPTTARSALNNSSSKFWVPSESSYSSHSHRSVSDGDETNGSRHSTQSDCACDSTRSACDANTPCRVRGRPRHGLGGGPNAPLPSSHYYIDSHGRLRVRRMWWCYTRCRRLLWTLLPWFKHDDSNTFVCSSMISNSALIVTVFFLRLIINHFVLSLFIVANGASSTSADGQTRAPMRCHEFSQKFLDLFSYSLIGNVMLCLPAFNLSMCKLFIKKKKKQAAASAAKVLSLASTTNGAIAASGIAVDDDEPQYEKTYLFTVLEMIVIFEIPYLIVTFVMLVYPSSDGLVSLTANCYQDLSTGHFIAFCVAQLIGLFAYSLRWNQIIIFHRMHEHFLYQRGCLPGRARFDYVESSFRVSLFASKEKKRRHVLQKELYRAAKYGDVDKVRELVQEAIEIDGPEFSLKWYGSQGWTVGQSLLFAKCHRNPLHVAVVFDQAEVVEELLTNGHFDVSHMEKMELIKLNISWVYRFLFEIVSFIKRSHFSVDKTRLVFGPVGLFKSTLLTPLHVAVSMGNTDMVLMLLRYGADPNLPALSSHRKYAMPALFWVVNKECTRLLLDADANPLYVPGKGIYLTPFEVARLTGNVAVARQMEKYGGDMALTPLHNAASRGFKDEVRFYLEHGADPNCLGEKVTGYFRRTPLHWAAMRGETGVMKVLLRYGAEVDAKDVFGRTPLVWACVLNRVKAVELLLVNGANVNIRDVQGDPILCICAAGACTTMSTSAGGNGGPPDSTGADGVAKRTNYDRNGDGGGGDREAHDDEHHHHSSLARSMDPVIFEKLKSAGVDLHAMRQCNGDSALHVALRKNNESAAILFVRAGISLTAANYMGQRAIDCATSSSLRYAIKKEAGHRDVMISYCHSHASLARKLRDALEKAHVTTWIDSMDPSGITGGSIWRQEIAHGIQSSALVLAMLTEDYPASQWCMKELAFAKMQNVPVVAIQCEDMEITEELQVYLWTRQIVDFRSAVKHVESHDHQRMSLKRGSHAGGDREEYLMGEGDNALMLIDESELHPESASTIVHEYDEDKFRNCMRLLLDGIQDQIEEHRLHVEQRQSRRKMLKRSKAVVNEQHGHDDDSHDDDDDDSESEDELTKQRSLVERRGGGATMDGDDGGDFVGSGNALAAVDPSTILSASSSSGSYVFIANGDYHKSFCQRLKTTLAKQGVRAVVDQAVPAVQYSYRSAVKKKKTTQQKQESEEQSDDDTAGLSVQARQMAAKDSILGCSAVLVVISPLSAKCDVLADQLAFAEDRGKLIIPVLLSLHTVDLAKRYTFSRSVVQHFNTSIGFEQSAETLVTYLRAQAQGSARQRRRNRRLAAASGEDNGSDGGGGLYSPASSTRSSLSYFPASLGFNTNLGSPVSTFTQGELPPAIPISTHSTQRRQPNSGTSGHGWSASNVSPDSHDALLYQQQHLHHDPSRSVSSSPNNGGHGNAGSSNANSNTPPRAQHGSGNSSRLSRLYSNGSTRTTEYLG